jgi:hypothetical protein
MGIFKKTGENFRGGLSDGIKEGMGVRHPSDTDYNHLADLNNDSSRSDDEVWLEFKIYCKKYDPKILDPNTQVIMGRILSQRPQLKEHLLKGKNTPE